MEQIILLSIDRTHALWKTIVHHIKIYHSLFHQHDAFHVDVCSLHGIAHIELFSVLGLEDDIFRRYVLHTSVSLDHLVYFPKVSFHIALDCVRVICSDPHLGHVFDIVELNNNIPHGAVLDNFLGTSRFMYFVLPKHLLRLLRLLLFLLGHIEFCLVLLYPTAFYLLVRLGSLVWREAIEELYWQLSTLYKFLIFLRLRIVIAKEVSVQQNTIRVHIYFDLESIIVVLWPKCSCCRAALASAAVVYHLFARRISRLEMLEIRLWLLNDRLLFLGWWCLMFKQAAALFDFPRFRLF